MTRPSGNRDSRYSWDDGIVHDQGPQLSAEVVLQFTPYAVRGRRMAGVRAVQIRPDWLSSSCSCKALRARSGCCNTR